MASEQARELWEAGTPLSIAWREFADETYLVQLRDTPGFANAFLAHAQNEPVAGVIATLNAFTAAGEAFRRRVELETTIKEALLDDLFNGELIATAYRERPSFSSVPIVIDAEHFDEGEPDWTHSTFAANGRVWNRVKVSRPPDQLASASRNGSADAIESAITDLIKSGTDFNFISRKEGVQKVRDSLGAKYRPGNGLSDVNIAKRIVAQCGSKAILRKKL